MNVKLVIFDLDGTLADTLEDLKSGVNHAMVRLGRPTVTVEQVRKYVGDGARSLLLRSMGEGAGQEDLDAAFANFMSYYSVHFLDQTRLYPGVVDTIDVLAPHMQMTVLSNKSESLSRSVLEGLGILHRFSAVYGGDSFAVRKPDPAGFRQIISAMRIPPDEALVVGDSANDIVGGKNAGAITCGVLYGFRPEEVLHSNPDMTIHAMKELPVALRSYKHGSWSTIDSLKRTAE